MSIIIAGRDTTAGALSACFYFLARHPHVVAGLRREIAALGTDDPTWEQLRDMKLLSHTLKECTSPPLSPLSLALSTCLSLHIS